MPDSRSRRAACARAELVCLALAGGLSADAPQPPRYVERVEVARVLVDVRVLDDLGKPIPDLEREDVHVKIDGKPARVESVQWVSGTAERVEEIVKGRVEEAAKATEPSVTNNSRNGGHLILFLFQKSLESSRVLGLMRMLIEGQPFLDRLHPADRVAVLSFDSHLRIWLDFTTDFDRVRAVFAHGTLFKRPPPVQQAPAISLIAHLDPARARRASSIEEALELIGAALKPLPGAKSVVLVGYGFGRLTSTGVTMSNRYDKARKALEVTRASVFCLDVTNADYHSLEVGLQTVAGDTGGFFARTHEFSGLALNRLAGAMAGHYVLFVERPQIKRGTHRLQVELTRRKGTLLVKSGFTD